MGCLCSCFEKKEAEFDVMFDERKIKRSILRKIESKSLIEHETEEKEEQEELTERYKITRIKLRNETKREKIIEEILMTEQNYVNTLNIFSDLILLPLTDKFANKNQKPTFDELKNKIDAVMRVNFTLLQMLEQNALSGSIYQKIGEIFKMLIPFLKLYRYLFSFSF